MRRAIGIASLACFVALPVFAGETPIALYATGHYEDAMKAGAGLGTAPGFVIAARAALADAQTRDQPCLPCLQRAEGFARHAVATDPKLPDGQTYLAVSLGYEARVVGPVTARFHNYPGHAKDALDAALVSDPKNPWALGALGGWNIEIVRTGGDTLADLLYGATVDQGLDAFARAFKAAPDNLAVRYQYALSLSGYDPDRFRHEIEDAFVRVAHEQPQTAYERLAQKRAAELAELLRKGDRAAFDARVRKYQGYP
ncbi:MAG TPA: hypothetical protein VMM27_14500 [Casimicrobiaceae bacterium]|nr:hypothetical protein [Casimicrobiaceae bacterium]